MSDEILTKGDLPHWYVPGVAHFVTFRLFGTLPRDLLDELRMQREAWLKQPLTKGESLTQQRERVHKQLFARYDRYLDQGSGECWLKDQRVALVRRSLYHLHGKQYDLKVFCIMPNHVHVVFVPFPDVVDASRVQVIKTKYLDARRIHHGYKIRLIPSVMTSSISGSQKATLTS